jgi:hypothetical protein
MAAAVQKGRLRIDPQHTNCPEHTQGRIERPCPCFLCTVHPMAFKSSSALSIMTCVSPPRTHSGGASFYDELVPIYYSIDGCYKRAPVFERQIATTWSCFPLVSLLVVTDNRTAIRRPANLDPLVADFVFNHSSCDRLRIRFHHRVPHPISPSRMLTLSVLRSSQRAILGKTELTLSAAMALGTSAGTLTVLCGHLSERT